MMKKIINILLVLLCIVMFCGCGKKNVSQKETENDVKMPGIVFSFFEDRSEVSEEKNPYFMTFIDCYGNIYSGDNIPEDKLYYGTTEEDYNSNSLSPEFEIVGKVDQSKVKEMYTLLLKAIDGGYTYFPEADYSLDVEAISDKWYATFYDDDDNLKCIKIHDYSGEINQYSDNSDIDAIFDWFCSCTKDIE